MALLSHGSPAAKMSAMGALRRAPSPSWRHRVPVSANLCLQSTHLAGAGEPFSRAQWRAPQYWTNLVRNMSAPAIVVKANLRLELVQSLALTPQYGQGVVASIIAESPHCLQSVCAQLVHQTQQRPLPAMQVPRREQGESAPDPGSRGHPPAGQNLCGRLGSGAGAAGDRLQVPAQPVHQPRFRPSLSAATNFHDLLCRLRHSCPYTIIILNLLVVIAAVRTCTSSIAGYQNCTRPLRGSSSHCC